MRSGIVLISHDRRLLARISRTTIWLDRGITRILKRASLRFEPWRDAMLEQEGRQHAFGRNSGSHVTRRWRKTDSNLYGAFPVK
jgi:ABC transport system ATP-binding/permease protein